MSDTKTVVTQRGASLSTLLLVLFIALKLTGHIGWSWLWVLSPAWIPIGVVVSVVVLLLLIAGVVAVVESMSTKKRAKSRSIR